MTVTLTQGYAVHIRSRHTHWPMPNTKGYAGPTNWKADFPDEIEWLEENCKEAELSFSREVTPHSVSLVLNVAFPIEAKDEAMLFKLTFGGL